MAKEKKRRKEEVETSSNQIGDGLAATSNPKYCGERGEGGGGVLGVKRRRTIEKLTHHHRIGKQEEKPKGRLEKGRET